MAGQGVTGFLPAAGFSGDGPGQLIAQLAGVGAISLLALLIGWLLLLGLNAPYRLRIRGRRKPEEVQEIPEAGVEEEEPEIQVEETVRAEAEARRQTSLRKKPDKIWS